MTLEEMVSILEKNGIEGKGFVESINQWIKLVHIRYDGLVYGKNENGEMINCQFDKISFEHEHLCHNCGKPSNEAKHCISGGYLEDGEWACSEACYDEMVEKGCCFEELGPGNYRPRRKANE